MSKEADQTHGSGHHHHHHHDGGANRFDEKADTYDDMENATHLAGFVSSAVTSAEWLPKHARVLEFGCGTGSVSINLADVVDTVVGVDIAPKMIAKFEEKVIKRGLESRYELRVLEKSDGSELEKDAFDVVLCPFVLHHAEEKDAIFRNLVESIKQNGHLVIAEFEKTDMSQDRMEQVGAHGWITEEDVDALCAASAHRLQKIDVKRDVSRVDGTTYHAFVCTLQRCA